MYPISDLTAFCRKTTGDVPPKLVGASTTVVGSKMYLYGGRLVSERKMVSDIYMFDLETFKWERVAQSPEDDIPQSRYFHSADTWRNHLIIFGGMAIKPQSDNPEDLCVLNDVRLFDLTTRHWLPSVPTPADSSLVPNARYAHLSSVTADRLFIIGGQDLANVWLDDVYIFDLVTKTWILRRDYPRHCGTYRSVAVTADQRVRLPQDELRGGQPSARLGQPGTRFNVDKKSPAAPNATDSEALIHLPYSASPTDDYPCDIFLFSNYNFTDVQRELEVFTPLSEGDFTVSDRSSSMTGTSFPPGLRFPTGAILGTFFIVAGTYLSQTYQSFSIWALDLINMTWSRIDPGSALASGSWFRSCLWASANKFVVFGNRHGNLVEDYNRRLLSWDHVTCIDLEAFGIYQPPPLVLDIPMQELGLAALEEGLMADFEIICDDGRRIKVSRKLLEDRWPWFKDQRRVFLQAASRALEAMPAVSSHMGVPELPGANRQEPRPDPRLTARSFNLSEPYPITLAFMQYFYSMSLVTPLQHAPAVLSQLLLLSSTYQITHLQSLVKHAMHRALSYATSVGIYGVSTLCSCRSLQIRALRVVMAYSQKRPAGGRAKIDKDAGAGGGRNSDASSGGGGGNSRLDAHSAARPRGMSDASYMRGGAESGSSASRGFGRGMTGSNEEEPLAVLADLQEFGLPGQDMPLPTAHPTYHKRIPDSPGSMLPPLSEDTYLDFSTMGPAPGPSSSIIARPPPPNMPLPSLPGQHHAQRQKRMGSIDTLATLDSFGDRDVVPIKSLPVPRPRRMASIDTISSASSSRDARSDRGQVYASRASSPSHSQASMPSYSRPFSVMSQSTEQDLLAIAEMLSPTVDAGYEEEPIPEGPPLAELDSFSDMYVDEVAARDALRESLHSSASSASSIYCAYHAPSTAAASVRSSIYTDSDGASYLGDEMPDPSLLSVPLPQGFRNHLNLPRGSLPMPALDDSRSLSSSTSYSSLRTPSLSRTSSIAYLASPPISPASSLSPIDGPSSPHTSLPHQNSHSQLLGIIEESLHSDEDSRHHRRPSSATETVNFDDVMDDSPARVFPPPRIDSYFDRSQNRNDMYDERRAHTPGMYRHASQGELRSPQRHEMRHDIRHSDPRHNVVSPPPTRRPPDLQKLQISNAVPSPSSAPVQDSTAMSPFGARASPQPRSALPSHRTLPFGPSPEQRSSIAEKRGGYMPERRTPVGYSDEERSPFSREMQSPFGRQQVHPTAHSRERAQLPMLHIDHRQPPTPSTASSISTQRSPLQFHSPASSSVFDHSDDNVYGKVHKLPPMPPVPQSPVPSVSSSSSSHKSKKSSGLGKLFGRGNSDKASKKGSDASIHPPSNKSVTSFETGMSKSEEKRMKKEAAKARTERLAQDLAEKAKRRAAEAKAAKEGHIKEKAKKPWEEGGGLYEGISYF